VDKTATEIFILSEKGGRASFSTMGSGSETCSERFVDRAWRRA
jgi:hypothetical protein